MERTYIRLFARFLSGYLSKIRLLGPIWLGEAFEPSSTTRLTCCSGLLLKIPLKFGSIPIGVEGGSTIAGGTLGVEGGAGAEMGGALGTEGGSVPGLGVVGVPGLGVGELAELPFPIHLHMLRHGTGYYLANKGIDTRTIQAYLGHKNVQYTVRYTELASGRFKGLWDS